MKKNQTLNDQSIEIDLDEQSNISDSDTDEETFDTEIKTILFSISKIFTIRKYVRRT